MASQQDEQPNKQISAAQQCIEKHSNFTFEEGQTYCSAVFDSFLCWAPTEEGSTATQSCPVARLSDVTRNAFRTCGKHGRWLNKQGIEENAAGWTNYTPCFPPEVQSLFIKFYESKSEENAQQKFDIAQRTRELEIAGFCVSLIFLVISLGIFITYRSLRNNRTRIHIHLFLAMTAQVLLRLILYFDQAYVRSYFDGHSTSTYDLTLRGIDNIPYLCEGTYISLEYATTVMFLWMFIEGMYLHNVVAGNALRELNSQVLYYVAGWGLPFINIFIWATANAYFYSENKVTRCWYGYNFHDVYWIVQVPRMAVILCNFCFLLNIMRVLIVKLKRSENTEVEKVRKAVRAALVLLPLLGLTNALNMTEAPLGGAVWQFALWSYSTHFFRSFQGFFIAVIYCFLNGEVRQVLKKTYDDFMAMHPDAQRHRDSLLHFLSSSDEHRPDPRIMNRVPTPSKPTWMLLRRQRGGRIGAAGSRPVEDIEMGVIRRPQISPDDMPGPSSEYLERPGPSCDDGAIPGPSNEDRVSAAPSLASPEDFADPQVEAVADIEMEPQDDDNWEEES